MGKFSIGKMIKRGRIGIVWKEKYKITVPCVSQGK
jgi:hypothetical protein